jgi:hypothetical protein
MIALKTSGATMKRSSFLIFIPTSRHDWLAKIKNKQGHGYSEDAICQRFESSCSDPQALMSSP